MYEERSLLNDDHIYVFTAVLSQFYGRLAVFPTETVDCRFVKMAERTQHFIE